MEKIRLTVNGNSSELLVHPHEKLSHVLRERLRLTGTKTGCDQGSCGACTVLMNGTAVLSCITPAMRCDGAEITTIEALDAGGSLHALQRHFVEKGAIQCGFCTPGMVLTALGMTPQLSALRDEAVIRERIREGLSGNLCRCTGYQKIVEAVTAYVLEQHLPQDKHAVVPPSRVGTGRPYIEAGKKARGTAVYADDIPLKNALHCRILRSIHPHARIASIDVSGALAVPGVKAVVTGKELPAKFGVLPISQDETALAVDKVRYIGEGVAAVAAETEEAAAAALEQIRVEYLPMKSFLEIDDSLNDIGDAEKIHAHTKFNNNIHKKAELRFGDQEEGLKQADITSEMAFEFAGVSHAFTEPHAAAALWDENGLTVYSATQVPHYLHRALAKVLEVPLHRVRVVKPAVGGGFGGKSDPFPHEILVAWLSRKTGRPVKIRLSREEVFISNHGRHPTRLGLRMGADNNGTLQVLDADIAIDGGAYGSFGVVTSYYNGVLLQAPYRLQNFGFRTYRVYTNKPQCGAMRGHGAVNSRFAVECVIDELAHRLGMDPVELRMKNFLDSDTLTVGQYRITSNGSRESLARVAEQSAWKERHGKLEYGHGLGVGCGFFISGSALPIIWNELPQSVVHLKLDFDGRVVIYSGASDIGQGSDTMLAIITAEVLGIGMDRIAVLAGDTLHTPVDLGSYSSRVTFMAGNAARMAAENLRKAILDAVAVKHGVSVSELRLEGERVASHDGSVNLSWPEAVDIVTAGRGAIRTHGQYISPKLGGDFKGSGAGLSPSYSFGACVAEVRVDTETGAVNILDVWGAHDCGKAINPLAVEGQLEGSWHMGIGQALSEEMKYYNGLLVNNNFLDYKIPTSLDTPPMHANIIETNDPEGPFGAKECGEGALHPVLPAIANAIYDAVGVRVKKLPITAEYILHLLKERQRAAQTEPIA
jgi:4-hydroxybenzoyl-CoA reductase subunit alpha